MTFFISDPKTKEPSVTITMFIVTGLVCCFKLLLSGLTIGPLVMSAFSGGDFAAALGAAGVIYAGRKFTDKE